ncbi:MAG: adenylate/guanylate cyclase domain-containing protein [Leptolyngbyaceae cyanobacterium bins.59]|nr:adenylate/guanylate cyclase domain-containing protein [Leptolyngbyaceae cyanobacterium bins.59]
MFKWLRGFHQRKQIKNHRHLSSGLPAVLIASFIVLGFVLSLRESGRLEFLELLWYDGMVRLRPDRGPDPRLLVVEITEADIRFLQRWPPSDRLLAKVLRELQKHQPRAIGLDLVRDIPIEPGHTELRQELTVPNVVSITSIESSSKNRIAPPPGVPLEQIGFVDLPLDPDGTIRRSILSAHDGEKDLPSLALLLALLYLEQEGIEPQPGPNKELQLGSVVFTPLERTSGGYQTVEDEGYQILLNYRSAKQVARRVSLTQVLQGNIDPTWVKDRIVLIGAAAPTLKDLFFTPHSHTLDSQVQMPGVLIHAQSVSQILSVVLDGEPVFWFWENWVEALWILMWTGLGSVLAWRVREALISSLVAFLLLSSLAGISYTLFLRQGWIPVISPTLAFVLAGGLILAYQGQQAWQQQFLVMRLLGQQTSPEIATALWEARDRLITSGRLPWQTLTATILFADIRHFSALAEQMAPEEVMDVLNQYLSAMAEEVQAHQGIINKFTGDGLMAVFGVPIPRATEEAIATDARHAVSCALAMGDRLRQLNYLWQRHQIPTLQMRVGIYTGHVVVGSLGGKHRLEYGVIGDSVNIASRLESHDKDRQDTLCRILAAWETIAYLPPSFKTECWGTLQLRGREKPVEVHHILGSTGPLKD